MRSFRARLSGLQQFPVEESPSKVSRSAFGSTGHNSVIGDSSSLFSLTPPSQRKRPDECGVTPSLLLESRGSSPPKQAEFTFTLPSFAGVDLSR